MGDFPRAFVKIQKLRRIAIPPHLMKLLDWKVDDEVIIEAYHGKLIVSSTKESLKPVKERYR